MGELAPFEVAELFGNWQFRPGVAAAVLAAGGAYAVGVLRARRTGTWPLWRAALFATGLAVIVLATCGGTEPYGHALESVHMVEHLALIMVAPPLLAAGSPLLLADRALPAGADPVRRIAGSRPVRIATSPAAALVAYTVVVVGVHLTGLMERAMVEPGVHIGEELAYLGSGCLLFALVFGQLPGGPRLSTAGRLILLMLATPVDTLVGIVLLQGATPAAVAGDTAHGGHGAAASDTYGAGAVMWIGGTGIMGALLLAAALAWLHGRPVALARPGWLEEARAATFSEHTHAAPGDLDDDDAALEAYNAWLGRLNEPGQRR